MLLRIDTDFVLRPRSAPYIQMIALRLFVRILDARRFYRHQLYVWPKHLDLNTRLSHGSIGNSDHLPALFCPVTCICTWISYA